MKLIELINSLKWYFELKNQSLIDALSIRCPMNIDAEKALRIYYSQYFSALISITELLKEGYVPENQIFVKKLYSALAFQSIEGKDVYNYMRELRNSIVHRGFDITSAAHCPQGYPLIICPSDVSNKNGTKQFDAPFMYLIQLINHCENVISDLVVNHIIEFVYEDAIKTEDNIKELASEYIKSSIAMPEWVKINALESINNLNFDEIYKYQVDSAIETIKEKFKLSDYMALLNQS